MRFAWVAVLVVLVLGGVVAGGFALSHREAARPIDVTLISTNEVRARIRRCGCQGPEGRSTKVEQGAGVCCKKFRITTETFALDPGAIPERSAWLAQRRTQEGEDPIGIDTGDLFFPSSEAPVYEVAEWKRRAELLVETYDLLGVRVVVPGELDLALGREELLRLAGRAKFAMLAANVATASGERPFKGSTVIESRGARIGVIGIVSPPSSEAFKQAGLALEDPEAALRRELQALASEHVSLVVLAAHASEKEVRALGAKVPGVDMGFAAHPEAASDSETEIDKNMFVGLTVQGGGVPVLAHVRIVPGAHGVVSENAVREARNWVEKIVKQRAGLLEEQARATPERQKEIDVQLAFTAKKLDEWRAKLPKEPRHEVRATGVLLDARAFKAGQDQRVLEAIERFKEDVDRLALEPALLAKLEAKDDKGRFFRTAQDCTQCHAKQTEVWKTTRHSQAWASLERAANTKDPECVRCHSIGFRQPGGFAEARRAQHDGRDYRAVQCEACHGPRSTHPEGALGLPLPKPDTCVRCHDAEHDPGFMDRITKDPSILQKICARGM